MSSEEEEKRTVKPSFEIKTEVTDDCHHELENNHKDAEVSDDSNFIGHTQMSQGLRRNRKQNFTHKEVSVLLQCIMENRSKLLNKAQSAACNKTKQESWTVVARLVTEIEAIDRTVEECKKKWVDLRTCVLKYIRNPIASCDRRPDKEPPYMDPILRIIYCDNTDLLDIPYETRRKETSPTPGISSDIPNGTNLSLSSAPTPNDETRQADFEEQNGSVASNGEDISPRIDVAAEASNSLDFDAPPGDKTYSWRPFKRRLDSEPDVDSAYEEYWREATKTQKLKQRLLQLKIKLMEKDHPDLIPQVESQINI